MVLRHVPISPRLRRRWFPLQSAVLLCVTPPAWGNLPIVAVTQRETKPCVFDVFETKSSAVGFSKDVAIVNVTEQKQGGLIIPRSRKGGDIFRVYFCSVAFLFIAPYVGLADCLWRFLTRESEISWDLAIFARKGPPVDNLCHVISWRLAGVFYDHSDGVSDLREIGGDKNYIPTVRAILRWSRSSGQVPGRIS